MLNLLIDYPETRINLNNNIINSKKIGMFDGAYKVIEEAFKR